MITGYTDHWSARAGEAVTVYASSHLPGPAHLSLVKISCGDPTSAGPGYSEQEVESDLPPRVHLDEQPLVPGSSASVDLAPVAAAAGESINQI